MNYQNISFESARVKNLGNLLGRNVRENDFVEILRLELVNFNLKDKKTLRNWFYRFIREKSVVLSKIDFVAVLRL